MSALIFSGNFSFTSVLLFYLAIPFVAIVTAFYSVVAAITRPFDRKGAFYQILMRQWSRLLLMLLRVRLRVEGLEHVDPKKQYIYVANHSSYLDVIAIGAALPGRVLLVYKEELTKVPVWGWSLRISPLVMIRRSDPRHAMESIEQAAADIRERGASVAIFPEGTRSADGKLAEFRRGGFLLAAKTGVPLVPLAIKGAYLLLPRDEWRVRAGILHITIGEPIPGQQAISRDGERALQQQTYAQLAKMLDEGA